jgi:CelD/BcsL family acetyltransferase involved in cellulose biosynthesis
MTDIVVENPSWAGPDWKAVPAERTHRRTLRAEIVRGSAAYSSLASDWQHLAERQQSAIPFQTPALLLAWANHFETSGSNLLSTVVVRKPEGEAVLIWPLVVENKGLVRVARGAGTPVGQYDEMLLDPECDAADVFQAARAVLRAEVRPDLVFLERVRADSALRAALKDTAPLGPAEGAPYADLSNGAETFMDGQTNRLVRERKKRMRRFEKEGNVQFAVAANADEAEAWLGEAIEIKREWLRSTGKLSRAFLRPETIACLLEYARTLWHPEASPRVVVTRVSLDGKTAALELGICHRGTYHVYMGAFSPELAKFSPGSVLTEQVLHWCEANGISRYDWLAPRSANKESWQSGEVEVNDYALPLTLRGRLYSDAVLHRLRPALRRGFHALPAPVRSKLAAIALRKPGNGVQVGEAAGDRDVVRSTT